MDILIAVAIEGTFLFLITCIQTFFYSKVIGLSQKWRGTRLILVIFGITILESVLQIAAMNAFLWVSLLFLIIVISYPVFFMGGDLKERLFFGVMNLAILMFSILLSTMFFSGELVQNLSEVSWRILLPCALMLMIYGILVLIIVHINTEGRRYLSRQYWTGMIACFFIVLFGLFVIQYFNRLATAGTFRLYLSILSAGLLIIWLLLYFTFYFICRYFSKTKEANALLVQNDRIEQYLLEKQASDERIKILSHDLKHSLVQWRELAEEKNNLNALHDISDYDEQLLSSLLINVENENANAIINQKSWEADQAKVEFQVDGIFHDDLLISKLDLCSLLGNLLDNALEAAVQAEAKELRRVKLFIRRKGNLLILISENGYAIEPALENGIFVTHKKDKNLHALGMRSIEAVVEKYDGVINHSYKNNWFKITIMLRSYQTVLSDEK